MAIDAPPEPKEELPPTGAARDPIVGRSLSWHLAIASVLLLLSTVWAAYDEFFGRRPWKRFQSAFVPAYRSYLGQVHDVQRKKEADIHADPEYQQLQEDYLAVQKEVTPERRQLAAQLSLITLQLEALTDRLKDARSYTSATLYRIETAGGEQRQEQLRTHLAKYHEGPFRVDLPGSDGKRERKQYNYEELLGAFNRLQDEKSELRRRLGELVQQESERKKEMDAYFAQRLDGPSSDRVHGMIASLADFRRDITSHQIHVEEVGLVDRCEVCHLATRSPVAADVDGIRQAAPGLSESMAQAFTSHPRIELPEGDLLRVHDPERFGCTPCHGGNGRALNSVDEAHGRYKHWLWPLYDRENTEAGCLQCHQDALRLEGAPTLSRGRHLFLRLACWGCHPRDGYDVEAMALRDLAQEERFLEAERARLLKEQDAVYESDLPDVEMQALTRAIMQKQGQLDAQADHLALRKAGLEQARKNPAPNLKEIRAKLHPEWLPVWLRHPRDFRPSTRMPDFGLSEPQVQAIAAFLWQSADAPPPPPHSLGDAERGQTLFELRGCRACHTLDGSGAFAADLARVGEKTNPDYLVEWILNPPSWTIMPNLRLDEQEARDIAAFLLRQKTPAEYPSVEYLEDASLFEQGLDLVKHFGCFGCHEIQGTENLSRIGTDLTLEGSKPIERLDFALFTRAAKTEHWYNHKGFFERKLSDPRSFDEGKVKLDWREYLKMPDFGLADKPEDRQALVTFLLGSVDSQLPEFFRHQPTGWSRDVQEGWWIVEKYNCVGCHEFVPGQRPEVWDLPQFQGTGREKAPPSLVGAGARLESDWLIKFLRNPALSDVQPHRNGVRLYLDMRMPSFALSEEEISAVVRFLNALSKQPSPYPFEPLTPLNEDELADARKLFLASECLACHVTSDDLSQMTPEDLAQIKAPGYTVGAERLKPRWMRRWLRDPQVIMPGTVMPSNFQKVDDIWKANVLLPDSELRAPGLDQIELLLRYQKFFDEAEAQHLLQLKAQLKPE